MEELLGGVIVGFKGSPFVAKTLNGTSCGVRTDSYPPPFTRTNGNLYQTAGVLQERLKRCALKGLSRADVVVWLADSGQRPVEQKTSRVTNPVNPSPYIISNVYISHSYCKHFGCWSNFHNCSSPRPECDRRAFSVQDSLFHSTLERSLCRLFHNPNWIPADSRICHIWLQILAADGGVNRTYE